MGGVVSDNHPLKTAQCPRMGLRTSKLPTEIRVPQRIPPETKWISKSPNKALSNQTKSQNLKKRRKKRSIRLWQRLWNREVGRFWNSNIAKKTKDTTYQTTSLFPSRYSTIYSIIKRKVFSGCITCGEREKVAFLVMIWGLEKQFKLRAISKAYSMLKWSRKPWSSCLQLSKHIGPTNYTSGVMTVRTSYSLTIKRERTARIRWSRFVAMVEFLWLRMAWCPQSIWTWLIPDMTS